MAKLIFNITSHVVIDIKSYDHWDLRHFQNWLAEQKVKYWTVGLTFWIFEKKDIEKVGLWLKARQVQKQNWH